MGIAAFNEPRIIEQAGVPVSVLPLGSYGLNSAVDSYFVKADFYKDPANQDILVKYLKAETKAWDAFFKDPAGMAKWFLDGGFNDGLDLAQQTYQAETQVKYMTSPLTAEKGIFWIDPTIWQQTAENAVATGAAKEVPKFDDLLTTDILVKVAPPKH